MGAPLVGAALAANIARSYFKDMELKENILRESETQMKREKHNSTVIEKQFNGGKDSRLESNANEFEHHSGRGRTDTEVQKVNDNPE